MDTVLLSRWQFGITSIYHFVFVPLTIGLAVLVAIMETKWVRSKEEKWLQATKFFGKLFVINFTLGVATGLVQEFQFGMNWSNYSKYVGDIFGAPLAFEALIAFFLESTFLGLWIFGWDRLSPKIHLLAGWLFAIATSVSALWIIIANGFMQHPVGAKYNPATHRAELVDFGKLITNSIAWIAFSHTVSASFLLASIFVAGVSVWKIVSLNKKSKLATANLDSTIQQQTELFHSTYKLSLLTMIISGLLVLVTGHTQMVWMFENQPIKAASAEMICDTQTDPPFSVLTVATDNSCTTEHKVIKVPGILSFLLDYKFSGVDVQGINNLQQQYVAAYGPNHYVPNLLLIYWSFRLMVLSAGFAIIFALFSWFYLKKKLALNSIWLTRLTYICIVAVFTGHAFGWTLTEMGRQPWMVYPNPHGDPNIHLTVQQGVSNLHVYQVWITVIGFTLIYLIGAVIWYYLMRRYIHTNPYRLETTPDKNNLTTEEELSFAY